MTQTELISHNQWPSYLSQWQLHSQLHPRTCLPSPTPPFQVQPHVTKSHQCCLKSIPISRSPYVLRGPFCLVPVCLHATDHIPSPASCTSCPCGEKARIILSKAHTPRAWPDPLTASSVVPVPPAPIQLEWSLSMSSVTPCTALSLDTAGAAAHPLLVNTHYSCSSLPSVIPPTPPPSRVCWPRLTTTTTYQNNPSPSQSLQWTG